MIAKMYLKELKQFFRKPFNLVFMLVSPIILILLMGYAMSGLIGGAQTQEKNTDSEVLYYLENGTSDTYIQKFTEFRGSVEQRMELRFQETRSFEEGHQYVDQQKAIALIRVSSEGFYYYRSPYNEPAESKMLRTAYHTLLASAEPIRTGSYVETKEIRQKPVNSYTYFTFAELGFIMIYLSLIVGQSVFSEKESRTFDRIYTSKASISNMLISKIALGITVGAIQTLFVYLLSRLFFHVDWGSLTVFIFPLYILLALFSSTFGAMFGLFTRKKTALNDRVLMVSIFVGFLGGGLTPLSFLDTVKGISLLCKMSPLYWTTNAAIALSGGKITVDYTVAIVFCLLIPLVLMGIYLVFRKRERRKGGLVYV